MSYDIIIRFPDKVMADEFAGQMSDGFGEGLMDFRFHQQLEGTDGTQPEHFVRVHKDGTPVYFVREIFKL